MLQHASHLIAWCCNMPCVATYLAPQRPCVATYLAPDVLQHTSMCCNIWALVATYQRPYVATYLAPSDIVGFQYCWFSILLLFRCSSKTILTILTQGQKRPLLPTNRHCFLCLFASNKQQVSYPAVSFQQTDSCFQQTETVSNQAPE